MKKYKKLTMALTGLFILVFSWSFFILYYSASIQLQSKQEQKILLERQNAILEIESDFGDIEATLKTIAGFLLTQSDTSGLLSYLESIDENEPFFMSLYYVTPNNTMVNSSGFIPPITLDLRTRIWYQMAIVSNEVIYTPAFVNLSQDRIIVTMAYAVYQGDLLLGVLGVDIDIRTISEFVSHLSIGETGFAFLVDTQQNLLAFPDMNFEETALIPANDIYPDLQIVSGNGIANPATLNGTRGVLAYAPVVDQTYSIGVFMPLSEYSENNTTLSLLFILITIVLSGAGVGILIIFYQRVSRPVYLLLEDMNRVDIVNNREYQLPIDKKAGFLSIRNALNEVLSTTSDFLQKNLVVQEKLSSHSQEILIIQSRLIEAQKMARIGNWELDLVTRTIWASDEAFRIYGIEKTSDFLPLREAQEAVTSEYRKMLDTALIDLIRYETKYNLEFQIRQIDTKQLVYVHSIARLLKDNQGKPIRVIGTIQDITKAKQMENALRESKEKYIAIFEQSPIAIEFYDAFGVLVHLNEACIQLYGILNKNDVQGFRLFENIDLSPETVANMNKGERIQIELEFDFEEVKRTHLFETSCSGFRTLSVSISPLLDGKTLDGYVVQTEDITLKKLKHQEIEYLSYHDFLTDLYNRRYFVEAFGKLNNSNELPLGIMMFDVNGLKILNDAYGHGIGDKALIAVAEVLNITFEKKDIVARIGGDEFAVLIPHTTLDIMQGYKEALKLSIVRKPIMNVFLSLAIGYEIMTDSTKTLDEMLKMAENHMYRHKIAEGVSVRNRAIQAILNTLSEKYEPERIHSERVSTISRQIGEALLLRPDDLNELTMAGMFHDIGKISIPDSILEKPGKLTPEEYEIIKTHSETGYQILRAADQYSDLAIHALSHHERWDGNGYPQRLKGEQIPFFSRIIGIADAFEAMTAKRPYRKALSIEEAKNELNRYSGSQFDPSILKVFIEQVLPLQHI